jgi:hypothetical protein
MLVVSSSVAPNPNPESELVSTNLFGKRKSQPKETLKKTKVFSRNKVMQA